MNDDPLYGGPSDVLLNAKQVARILGCHDRHLMRLRRRQERGEIEGAVPPAIKVGRNIRWHKSVVDKFIAELKPEAAAALGIDHDGLKRWFETQLKKIDRSSAGSGGR